MSGEEKCPHFFVGPQITSWLLSPPPTHVGLAGFIAPNQHLTLGIYSGGLRFPLCVAAEREVSERKVRRASKKQLSLKTKVCLKGFRFLCFGKFRLYIRLPLPNPRCCLGNQQSNNALLVLLWCIADAAAFMLTLDITEFIRAFNILS